MKNKPAAPKPVPSLTKKDGKSDMRRVIPAAKRLFGNK